MVKKRLADGEACRKCQEAEAWLVARDLWSRIDEVVWFDERDPASAGAALADKHGVALAPFFVVRGEDASESVVTSAVALARLLQAPASSPAPAPAPRDEDLDAAEAERLLAGKPPLEVVTWALARWGAGCTIAFSGAEDVVLIDLAARAGHPFRVFSLDTGRLHPETLEYLDVVRARYGVTIEVISPDAAAVERLVRDKGTMSMRVDGHEECCGIRKVEPLGRALAGARAWMTGQRPDQSPATRGGLPTIQWEARRGTWKLNPLAAWTSADVWRWIRDHDVPFNPLHERGYRSIGCAPCTRPVHPGQHEREGRWWWEDATRRECGLHLGPKP
ncbi:MAG: phosphoadenylyl-sulfate reductase [Deltaproteobacteria bacterium]|nr:phosphoadenylyl-sulfate reductase [Deltaproteobacteria bacterium]